MVVPPHLRRQVERDVVRDHGHRDRCAEPIGLPHGPSGHEAAVGTTHDPDPFNRWEAAQRLALGRLIEAVREAPADPLKGLKRPRARKRLSSAETASSSSTSRGAGMNAIAMSISFCWP